MENELATLTCCRPLDASEISSQAVKILLPPLLERMVVALGTVHADPQQGLADGPYQLFRCTETAVEISGTILAGIAGCREQLMHPFVIGAVAGHLLPQPTVHLVSTTVTQRF